MHSLAVAEKMTIFSGMNCGANLLLPFLLLLSLQGWGCSAQNYGDLRLLHGQETSSSFFAGRLEIYINSTWGSVCADSFNLTDAHVACRQLGYAGATSTETSFHTRYGRGMEGPIWLDEVSCSDSSLMHILSCPNNGLGRHDCDHFSDVAITCVDEPKLSAPVAMDVRLGEGGFQSEGRVEIFCNDQWEVVCNQESFRQREADAVCRQLGFTEASEFSTGQSVSLEALQLPMWQGQLDCPANESSTSLASCGECVDAVAASGASSSVPVACSPVNIRCAHTLPYGSLRLAWGSEAPPNITEGRLEIFRNGLWGTVCSSEFDMLAANISCRQLGFVRALDFENSTNSEFGTGTGPVLLTGLECSEDSGTLVQCSTTFLEECDHSQDVILSCTNFVPVFPPNTTMTPTDDGGLKISTATFVGIMVGVCLLLAICCVCCAVCSIHFCLVPYDTKKENHGLYFIEREEGMEAETSLDQKIADMEAGTLPRDDGTLPATDDIVAKSLDDDYISRDLSRRKKNRYVPLDTTQGSLISQSENQQSPAGDLSTPQGMSSSSANTDSSVPMPEGQTPISPIPLELQSRSCKVSVHSLNLPGTPKIPKSARQPRPRQELQQEQQLLREQVSPTPTTQSKGSMDSILTTTTSLASFQASQASLSGVATAGGPIPTAIPIPPPLKPQVDQGKARVSLKRTSFGDDDTGPRKERYERASSADACELDMGGAITDQWEELDHHHSTDLMISSPAHQHATPTKSIIKSSPKFRSAKSHHQGSPQLDRAVSFDSTARRDSTPGETNQTHSTDSVETTRPHRVSFQLD